MLHRRIKVGTRLVAFLGLLACFALVVWHEHRPGDFHAAIVGIGVTIASFAVILGIMQTRGGGGVELPGPENDVLEQLANSGWAVVVTFVVGVVVALVGLLFPTL